MKILILGINFAPEIISTGLYTTGLARKLSARHHDVKVVTAHPYYPAWRRQAGYPRFWYRRALLDGTVSVIHCPHYVPARPSGTKRILHHASFALTALPVMLYRAATQRPDLVVIAAPALLAAPVAWLAARLSRAKCWLHIQDLEIDAAFATGLLKKGTRSGRLALMFEKFILSRFDKISTISTPMMQKLREKGVDDSRLYELRNWAELDHISPKDVAPAFKETLGISTPFVALYSGNLANKQGLEIIPHVAHLLRYRSDLGFVICGDGPMAKSLKAQSEGSPNISFHPLQPVAAFNDLLGMATIHLLPQIAGAEDLVLPSKLTNMLASGRPIVATTAANSALGQEMEGCGVTTPPGDAAQMAKAIADLLDDPEARARMGKAARARALDCWDGEAVVDAFVTQADQLIRTGGRSQ